MKTCVILGHTASYFAVTDLSISLTCGCIWNIMQKYNQFQFEAYSIAETEKYLSVTLHALKVIGDTLDHLRTHCQGNSKTGIQVIRQVQQKPMINSLQMVVL